MRLVSRVMLALLALIALLVVALLWMAGGVQSARTFEAPPVALTSADGSAGTTTSTGARTLRVVVWNIAWAYGWGSEGSGSKKPPEHFEAALDRMGAVLRAAKPDLVLMQEVDFGAARSYRTHQAKALAEKAGLGWYAEAVSWDANYLPFPYWPPEDHYGRILSGGAVLSRFPLKKNVVELYPKPEDNSFVYNLGYVFRYLQRVEVELDDQTTVPVFNAHLDAFSPKNRQAHAGHIARVLSEVDNPLAIFGADLNTVPPESTMRSGYPDEPKTDHADDVTLPRLRSVDGWQEALTEEAYLADEASYFTFPAHAPNRKLDYLFTGSGYEVVDFHVLKDAGDVSDHLPIFAELRVKTSE